MAVLIDTSSWSQALRRKGDPATRDRVRALMVAGEAAWCELVRVELWYGVSGQHEEASLEELNETLPRLELNAAVWNEACRVGPLARKSGLTVPNADVIIFACARIHGARLEHNDKHFDLLAKLKGL